MRVRSCDEEGGGGGVKDSMVEEEGYRGEKMRIARGLGVEEDEERWWRVRVWRGGGLVDRIEVKKRKRVKSVGSIALVE